MQVSNKLEFLLNLSKVQTVLSRRFDNGLGGISLSEFIILYHLSQAKDGKLRRTDLADKIWLTASGTTRTLLPMEKIWLIKREANENDARVSFVVIAPGWVMKLEEWIERAEYIASEIIPEWKLEKITELSKLINEIWWAIMWNK